MFRRRRHDHPDDGPDDGPHDNHTTSRFGQGNPYELSHLGSTRARGQEGSHSPQHNADGRPGTLTATTADEHWETDLRLKILEQKIEVLYHSVNKVQNGHDELISFVNNVTGDIVPEAAMKGNPTVDLDSLSSDSASHKGYVEKQSGPRHGYFDDMRRMLNSSISPVPWSNDDAVFRDFAGISELPGMEEHLRELPTAGKTGNYSANGSPDYYTRPASRPPIAIKSTNRPSPPVTDIYPLLDGYAQHEMPVYYQFAREIEPVSSWTPPSPSYRSESTGVLTPEASPPIVECAYYASPGEMRSSPSLGPVTSHFDCHPKSYEYDRPTRSKGPTRKFRDHRETAFGYASDADDDMSSTSTTASSEHDKAPGIYTPCYTDFGLSGPYDPDLGRLPCNYSGPGWAEHQPDHTFGEPLRRMPHRHERHRDPDSTARHDFQSDYDSFPSTAAEEVTPSEASDGSDETIRRPAKRRSGQAAYLSPGESEVELRKRFCKAVRFAKQDIASGARVLRAHPAAQHRGRRPDFPRGGGGGAHQRQIARSLLSPHDLLGFAAIVLLSPEEQAGFPRDFDPIVRYLQGAMLWMAFLRQTKKKKKKKKKPATHYYYYDRGGDDDDDARVREWMGRFQMESHVARFLARYGHAGGGRGGSLPGVVDIPTCQHQAHAIVSALLGRAEMAEGGQVSLLELWRARVPRLRVRRGQVRDPFAFRRALDGARVNVTSLGTW